MDGYLEYMDSQMEGEMDGWMDGEMKDGRSTLWSPVSISSVLGTRSVETRLVSHWYFPPWTQALSHRPASLPVYTGNSSQLVTCSIQNIYPIG